MTGDNDPEKGEILPEPRPEFLEKDETKVQDGGDNADKDSIHSHMRFSEDTVEAAAVSETQQVSRIRSQTSSTQSRVMSVVPRSNRRGLLGRFTIIPEVERPYDYKNSIKWTITALVALAAAAAPTGSAIFYPALPELSENLRTSPTITNLSIAMYMLSMSIFPLWWSSFSETLGRRTIYLVSFALYVLWTVISAASTSIGMLVVMRILSGGAAASVQAVGAGTIADIWESRERGRAMGIFYLGPLMGPLLAPIIGGALSQSFGWRSTMWFLAIYGGLIWILLAACLPETLSSTKPLVITANLSINIEERSGTRPQLTRVSTRQSIQQKAKTIGSVFHRCIIEPLYVLTYLRFPAVALTVYYASITFGSLYILNIGVQQNFSQPPYSFPVSIIGLLYISASLGYIVASVFGGRWSDAIMHREARRANRYDSNGKLILIPEDRMRENAYIAAVLYPGALIWYGWATQYRLHWAIAITANFFFGLGSMIIFSVSTTMLTEFMPRKSSSGVAVNNFIRNIFSCVGGIIASPLIDAIGSGWLFTALGLLTWLSGTIMWAMRKYGPQWREEMERALN